VSLPRATSAAFALVLLLGVACSGGNDDDSPSPQPSGTTQGTFAADTGSSDLYVGAPQRYQIGVFSSSEGSGVSLLSGGSVTLRFSFLGGSGSPSLGPPVTADYLPAPTLPDPEGPPELRPPSKARGVYQAEDVTFDQAGPWQVELRADISGEGPVTLVDAFDVSEEPALPAPGDQALRTENLTIHSRGVPPTAVDSAASPDGEIPQPELHSHTIAEGIEAGTPVLALFSTPVYCQSQMCGPSTDGLDQIAKAHPDAATYVHVEIYRKYDPVNPVLNQAAADWLLRNNNLTEPWLFLIGPDGTIVDRWAPLFDPAEVQAELLDLQTA
jgi:hypothetical protein